jgi:hypothetical protein
MVRLSDDISVHREPRELGVAFHRGAFARGWVSVFAASRILDLPTRSIYALVRGGAILAVPDRRGTLRLSGADINRIGREIWSGP